MPYIVNYTDRNNKSPLTVFDNTSSTDTSLTFPGRNVAGYGQLIAENFLALLENFASTDQPVNPTEGQLWYDTSDKILKIYDGGVWKAASSIQKGAVEPPTETSIGRQRRRQHGRRRGHRLCPRRRRGRQWRSGRRPRCGPRPRGPDPRPSVGRRARCQTDPACAGPARENAAGRRTTAR